MNKAVLLIPFLLIASIPGINAEDYPPLIFEKGVDIGRMKEVVYSIPAKEFTGVRQIYFTNPTLAEDEFTFTYSSTLGEYHVLYRWVKFHETNSVDSALLRRVLLHELGHHHFYHSLSTQEREQCWKQYDSVIACEEAYAQWYEHTHS